MGSRRGIGFKENEEEMRGACIAKRYVEGNCEGGQSPPWAEEQRYNNKKKTTNVIQVKIISKRVEWSKVFWKLLITLKHNHLVYNYRTFR